MERHGPGLLLAVGQYISVADETPVRTVLLRSAEPRVLAEKWMRLERYLHTSHRTSIATGLADGWECRRHAAGPPPSLGENCLIAGLLLGLAGAVGLRDTRIMIGAQEVRSADLPRIVVAPHETLDRFHIRWSPRDGSDEPASREPRVAAPGTPLSDSLTDLLACDMGRSWRIGDAARELALSERSMQRRLRAEGRNFSSIFRRARMRCATDLLSRDETTLAEIGYCCGYADQAHFQRDFLRATNVTPTAFRRIALAPDSGAILQ
jgi:AraC-like DNA-binding protein